MTARLVLAALALIAVAAPCRAEGTPACRRELDQILKERMASLPRLRALDSMPQQEKCSTISAQGELERKAREVFARCMNGAEHDRYIADTDQNLDEVRTTYNRICPPRDGMVRVNMMALTRVAARELPPGLAAAHKCDTDDKMAFMNEPFAGGRIMLAGCAGHAGASPQEQRARNARAAALADEQVRVYLTLDSSGRGAQLLRFPIFTGDGSELAVATLPQQGTMPNGRDSVVANWAPADPAICRIHAEWRIKERKAELVLWQELADCKAPGPPAFKTIVDRRDASKP
jgi:hypothetical protein